MHSGLDMAKIFLNIYLTSNIRYQVPMSSRHSKWRLLDMNYMMLAQDQGCSKELDIFHKHYLL